MSPPLLEAAPLPVNGSHRTGTPRGSRNKYSEQEQKWFRVRVDEAGSIDPDVVEEDADGNAIRTTPVLFDNRLTYCLQARDGRLIPIKAVELADWLNRFYRVDRSKKRDAPAVYVLDPDDHGMWSGGRVAQVPLHRGSWWIKQSDDSVLLIPQMHTAPLSRLKFGIDKRGTVHAHYPETTQTPTETATKQVLDGGPNN
ncbi:hypothetical protein [Leucobacter japonicus]|uniref:hypothetical protein n=1 Tax=Leucobacter japonicus TaxID=1461259 RepID=UPI000A689D1C|nr:hypothetical protein [Leucobacter japonicus]